MINQLMLLTYQLIWQIATPTPSRPPVDPGNEPTGTIIFYILFMALALGGGVISFRWRMKNINKERALEKERNQQDNRKPKL
jgi:hypothetical protein